MPETVKVIKSIVHFFILGYTKSMSEEKVFKIVSDKVPKGDQESAISSLVQGLKDGLRTQVLLGVTGSGKTFTMANIIERVNRPTLLIAHNKTLAAQLCNELRELFPNNMVGYFVSYYDYYQPEAYIVSSDTYIEKEQSINEEIDKLRHSATCALFERRDVIIVASVSCIYGLGEPKEYARLAVSLRPGMRVERDAVISKLVDIQYKRSEIDFVRSTFRVKGDVLDIFPSNQSTSYIRVDFFGDEIEKISEIDLVTGNVLHTLQHVAIFPASHYATSSEKMKACLERIEQDMETEVQQMRDAGKILEAERLKQRVSYDIEMMREVGYCSGIENYSRYFDGREIGEAPFTLMDYFPDDFLLLIDESHITIPQIRAMYNGDKARKDNLVTYGFRLRSAYDNRPLKFEEWEQKWSQMIAVSATPGPYELEHQDNIAEQIIRPTGLLDPEIEVRPTKGQMDNIMDELNKNIAAGGRALITTLTKNMAEKLTDYLKEQGFKVAYLHSEVKTMERLEIINRLRRGVVDIVVGINLLREGLDMPEVRRVLILDADKEGFLRSEGALIQTIGRAARNAEGKVILYADVITESMQKAISETERRRSLQHAYNQKHHITPKTIIKPIQNTLSITTKEAKTQDSKDIRKQIETLKGLLKVAVNNLDFEQAIELRDQLQALTNAQNKKKT